MTTIEKLNYAKKAVIWCLNDNATISYPGQNDFHGLIWWANEVENLKKEIVK